MGNIVKDGINVEYSGTEGTSAAVFTATENQGRDKVVEFEVATTIGNAQETINVKQQGRREAFVFADGGELPIDVLKDGI